jgi:hypothetical protein
MSRAPSGGPPVAAAPPVEDFRPQFTAFLRSPGAASNGNWLTRFIVGNMNAQMVREGQPMTLAHFEAARDSVNGGDTICRYLVNENRHVLDSRGTGFVYRQGYRFHQGINFLNSPASDSDFPMGLLGGE